MVLLGNERIFTGNNETIIGNKCKVTGDSNSVIGDDCEIRGDYNKIEGHRCVVNGKGNRVFGTKARMYGVGNWNDESVIETASTTISAVPQMSFRDPMAALNSILLPNGCPLRRAPSNFLKFTHPFKDIWGVYLYGDGNPLVKSVNGRHRGMERVCAKMPRGGLIVLEKANSMFDVYQVNSGESKIPPDVFDLSLMNIQLDNVNELINDLLHVPSLTTAISTLMTQTTTTTTAISPKTKKRKREVIEQHWSSKLNPASDKEIENASQKACVVCLVNEPKVFIRPCRHTQVCIKCSLELYRLNSNPKCPVCRTVIEFVEGAY